MEEIRDDEDTSSSTSDVRQQMSVEDEKKNSNENEIAYNLQGIHCNMSNIWQLFHTYNC